MLRKDALDALLEVGSEQGGYVTTAQAIQLGVTRGDLTRLVRAGDLRRVRHGVYAMRHAQPEHEDEIAAWLAIERDRLPWARRDSPDAVISHESAAALHGRGTIIPTLPTLTLRPDARRYTAATDMRVHRGQLRAADWGWHETGSARLPVTTPARTIIDMLLDKQELSYIERATREALNANLTTPAELMEVAKHRKGQTRALQERIRAVLDSA